MEHFGSADSSKQNIGVVTFDSYVGMYASTLRYVSWKLQQLGCQMVRVGCDGVLGACTSFNSLGNVEIDERTKSAVCKACKNAQRKIPANFVDNIGVEHSTLKKDAVYFLNEVEAVLKEQMVALPVLGMHYLNLPLCKIAFFDFSITLKVSSTSKLNEQAISRFILGLRDLLLLQQYLEFLLQRHRFSHIVFVNGNYSLNTCVRLFCHNNGIALLSIEPQLTSQHILNYIVMKRDRIELSPEALLPVQLEPSIRPNYLSKVLENFGARITGGDFNAYTSLAEACDQGETGRLIRFLKSYSKVHSFFMSSEDELVPHAITHDFANKLNEETQVAYKDQLEFTKFYLAEAAKNPDIGFIIRIHPRMAKNKRDAFESLEHLRYKDLFKSTPTAPNVLIVMGDSKISSYYVISRSSLVIVSWSTIGLEALMMGIPVVSAFPNALMYPLDDLTKQPKNLNDLKSALFTCSTYGVADDMRLFAWISMAHEGQFFPTLAPRGQGGRWGRVYRLTYGVADRLGLYNLFAYIVDKAWFGDTIFSEKVLLEKRTVTEQTNITASQALVNAYRARINNMLNQYEHRFHDA